MSSLLVFKRVYRLEWDTASHVGIFDPIKTPNPKCRLYWCLTEFIDWRYSQSCWYFRPGLWTIAPLTSLVSSPPFPVWISLLHFTVYTYIQCVRWDGGVWGHRIRKNAGYKKDDFESRRCLRRCGAVPRCLTPGPSSSSPNSRIWRVEGQPSLRQR